MSQTDDSNEQFLQEEIITPEKTVSGRRWLFWTAVVLFPLSVVLNVYLLGGFGNRKEKIQPRNEDSNIVLQELKNEKLELERKLAILQPQSSTPQGVYFEVQLGAFENFNIDEYLSEVSEMRQEKHDGKNKLLLGRFTDLNKALRFENDMKRIGVSGAFIVGRVNGQLVSKETAIAALRNTK